MFPSFNKILKKILKKILGLLVVPVFIESSVDIPKKFFAKPQKHYRFTRFIHEQIVYNLRNTGMLIAIKYISIFSQNF